MVQGSGGGQVRLFLARGGRHTYWHISDKEWSDHANQAVCGTQLAELIEERIVTSFSELDMEVGETSVRLCPRCSEISGAKR